MINLYAGDKLVAGHFGVRQGDVYHPWIASTDPDLGRLVDRASSSCCAPSRPCRTWACATMTSAPATSTTSGPMRSASPHQIGEGTPWPPAGSRGRRRDAHSWSGCWALAGSHRRGAVGRLRRRMDADRHRRAFARRPGASGLAGAFGGQAQRAAGALGRDGLSPMNAPRVSLVIPTQRRPHGLATRRRARPSRQTGVAPRELELVVVDNDQVAVGPGRPSTSPGRRGAVSGDLCPRAASRASPTPATPRMAKAGGDFIAFLDDDEEAPAGWLAALLAAQARHRRRRGVRPGRGRAAARVTAPPQLSGAVLLPRGAGRGRRASTTITAAATACCAARPCPIQARPSPWSRNHIGGEDDLLFGHMKAAGARFAWEPAAWVWEDPVPDAPVALATRSRAPSPTARARRPPAPPPCRPTAWASARWMAESASSRRACSACWPAASG